MLSTIEFSLRDIQAPNILDSSKPDNEVGLPENYRKTREVKGA